MDAFSKLIESQQYMDVEADLDTPETPPLDDPPVTACIHSQAKDELNVFRASIRGGRKVPIVKTVLTSACERNCNYCAFRAGRDFRRFSFNPEEMAQAFMQMYRKGTVTGLFLSSGIAGGGVRTQDRLLATVEILRLKMGYRGYLHLKLMPGVERAQVERAVQLADRVSVKLEPPTSQTLARPAPQKQILEELVKPLRWVEELRRKLPAGAGWLGKLPSSVTQFVVGAVGETDLELLRGADYLHQKLKLQRVYFSGFNPVPGTPFENQPPSDALRRARLYQASFLLRDYGFGFEDLPFTAQGGLPLDVDPKTAWARQHLSPSPLEVNRAGLEELLRVPGIGRHSALEIVRARRMGRLRELDDLKHLGIAANRAAPFILLDGHAPVYQMRLW